MELKELGIIASKEKQFKTKGIEDVKSLLEYLPRKYNDFSHVTGIRNNDEYSCVIATCMSVNTYETTRIRTVAFCMEESTGRKFTAVWFNQKWKGRELEGMVEQRVLVAGKFSYSFEYGNYSVNNPDLFTSNVEKGLRIYPVYSKIQGMSYDYLTDKINTALMTDEAYEDLLPDDIIKSHNLLPMSRTYQYLHWPNNMKEVDEGKDRLAFNDLTYFAIHNEWSKKEVSPGSQFNIKTTAMYEKILNSLPFKLTEDQQTTVDGMIESAKNGRRINALVQGDVGSGKSIVAFLLMAAFVESGYQTVLMAPTQVLARQHYNSAAELFSPYGIEVIFVGGEKLKKKEENELRERISSGKAQIVIGTHAAFSEGIQYANLALTIVDEEHKFGVAQRAAIVNKAAAGVHTLTMSATPIPRSLAQIVYGDAVQLYTIYSMPEGRKPIITGIAASRQRIYKFLCSEVKKGHQAYIVCPMIENSDSELMANVSSVEQIRDEYTEALAQNGVRIATLTGRNSKEETEDIIGQFVRGETDVLISTTVIEVGVNVPNATVMIISNAERFGLSQMHQLRGRIGRGSFQSFCILESEVKTGPAAERMEALCKTTSGFDIANADLKLRGAGDFVGTRQSGENKYISLLLAYPEMYKEAKVTANELLAKGKDCCKMVQNAIREREELTNVNG